MPHFGTIDISGLTWVKSRAKGSAKTVEKSAANNTHSFSFFVWALPATTKI
jgi:hypothetical protein